MGREGLVSLYARGNLITMYTYVCFFPIPQGTDRAMIFLNLLSWVLNNVGTYRTSKLILWVVAPRHPSYCPRASSSGYWLISPSILVPKRRRENHLLQVFLCTSGVNWEMDAQNHSLTTLDHGLKKKKSPPKVLDDEIWTQITGKEWT